MAYTGVKFTCHQLSPSFSSKDNLVQLNRSAWLFSQLGLAPLHDDGAYGNFSCRGENDPEFFISKSGMIPVEEFTPEQFCHITACDEEKMSLDYHGLAVPSSEAFMHHLIYQNRSDIGSILHGHCAIMTTLAEEIGLPVTPQFFEYGTEALARAGLELAESEDFFILKDHGFVSLGEDINIAARQTYSIMHQLLSLLESS
jgi:ribulose-5-phosphate 4-epimerase/fuculose-1-phosphate aldolase